MSGRTNGRSEIRNAAGCTGGLERCVVGFAAAILQVDGTAAIVEYALARAECMEGR